jgi:hypothetical protein
MLEPRRLVRPGQLRAGRLCRMSGHGAGDKKADCDYKTDGAPSDPISLPGATPSLSGQTRALILYPASASFNGQVSPDS